MKRYLGVDLHRTQFTVCTRLENGRTYLRQWPLRELKLFAAQLRKEDELAVEATGNTRLFYDAVVEKVAHVTVVNPSQFKVISQSVKKTDKNDAELLALYLAKGLLPEVRMKERNREMSHLAQTRDLLVKQRSALKAKINNLLSAEGINLKREALSSNKALERVLALPLSPLMLAEARVLVGQIRSLNQSIAELEGLIEEEGPKLAGHENLISVKGIGPVSASVLLSAIGNIRDFSDPGKLAAYFGLVPRIQYSNETERSGHITKQSLWSDRRRCADRGLGCEFVKNRSSEPQAERAGHEGEGTISRLGCPCRNDSRSDCRTGWRDTKSGYDSEPLGIGTQALEEAWPSREVAGLL